MKIDIRSTFSGVLAHVSHDEFPVDFKSSLDVEATLSELQAAINALKGADGKTALQAAGNAFFRLASFHRG